MTNYKLDISQLAEGVYYLKVTYQNQKIIYQKIMKR
ncbi:MAG: T9SS type A sorting domain-containing protein [Bacteroidia bacterium]